LIATRFSGIFGLSRMKKLLTRAAFTGLCSLLYGFSGAVRAQSPVTPAAVKKAAIEARLNADVPHLENLYKHLHANPELSLQEEKTSERIAEELGKAGLTVTRRVGGYGVVGVLSNGVGPTVLIRTDLDALPVKEETGLAFASKAQAKDDKGELVNVMHACGHDMHMTVFIGVARLLNNLKDQWQGTVVMIAQPAEERGKGARAMLADGLFRRFPKPNHCLALHCSANLPSGSLGYVEGYVLANVDSVDLTIRGVGGHGAWPQTTKDPIVLAAQTIMALQTIVSRETTPTEPAVVTVGSIHGGTKHNIIPEEVRLQLTLRSYSDETRNHTLAAIKRITAGLADAAGLPKELHPVVQLKDEFTPATYNNPELTRRLATALKGWFGEDKVLPQKPVMGGEDFSEFGRTSDKIPICMLWLGTVEPDAYAAFVKTGKALPSLHSNFFRPALQPTIKTGVTAMTAAVLELARKK
jgi:amidohydrolase